MDQYQTLTYLQNSLNTNAIYAFSTFFLLWVAFRFAGRLRDGDASMAGKIACTLFGLLVIWQGLILFASRLYSLATAAKGLRSLKASGQTLSAQADGFLNTPFAPAAGVEPQFGVFADPASVLFWLVATVMLLGVIWIPAKKKN